MDTQKSMETMLQQMQKMATQIDQISRCDIDPILFNDWANIWLKTWRKGLVSNITYEETYVRPIKKHLIPYFGAYYLHEITPFQIQQFFNLKAKKYTLESCKKMRNPLHSIFISGIENGHCRKSPVTSTIRVWSEKPNIQKHVWTQEQYDIAYEFAKTHTYGIQILILMETAISRSELLGLTWDSFNYKDMLLEITKGIVSCKDADTGKWIIEESNLKNSYRHREVPISLFTSNKLDIMMSSHQHRFIFCNSNGTPKCPDNWYKREFRKFMQELNKKYPDVPMLTTHELRHTRATLLNYKGVDLYTISRLMGHCDLTMLSKRYLHDDINAMRQSIGI
ncbi:tyrosine-type recombinase/integrase [Oscillibacter sp.]|uniref:tyrosine-type recombinase/integrase n=1 Tax=Oscillibacter sp. TaxID=1945593 RepID=UPI00289A404D|nr:tyrosine-type recombinase/integrase [Oscillibacter sp.]